MSYWTPPPVYGPHGDDPVLLVIGDVTVTQTSVILPHGRYPLRGTHWSMQNHSYSTSEIPAWAIILAIVGFLFVCVFSLFFLLAKETRTQGLIEVTVQGPGLHHVTRVAAINPYTAMQVQEQVGQAQALAAAP